MLDFNNKIILSPMVRVCNFAFRQLCLKYGADLVFSEKILDMRLINSDRRINNQLGTVDFINKTDQSLVFRTAASEHGKIILQIGTADPNLALLAAKKVAGDVAGIDVNMSDRKEYSQTNGIGSALLSDPDRARDILKNLVQNLSIPVTCKIRVLPNDQDTLDLVKVLESTNIKAITIHGRTKYEKMQAPFHTKIIQKICQNSKLPIIVNGGSREIDTYADILRFKESCGASSVMVARAALWNCSIFLKEGKLPLDEVIKDFLKLCMNYETSFGQAKHCVLAMLRAGKHESHLKMEQKTMYTTTMQQLCDFWNLETYAPPTSTQSSKRK
jgi:tRNA-dihydrouridine synthase 2